MDHQNLEGFYSSPIARSSVKFGNGILCIIMILIMHSYRQFHIGKSLSLSGLGRVIVHTFPSILYSSQPRKNKYTEICIVEMFFKSGY